MNCWATATAICTGTCFPVEPVIWVNMVITARGAVWLYPWERMQSEDNCPSPEVLSEMNAQFLETLEIRSIFLLLKLAEKVLKF